jgi:hypothetical protein
MSKYPMNALTKLAYKSELDAPPVRALISLRAVENTIKYKEILPMSLNSGCNPSYTL